VIEQLELRPDRVAVELNSEIAPRTEWPELAIKDGDRVEIVHFVGGGSEAAQSNLKHEVNMSNWLICIAF
jgi:thiamine biosynthesis protein ThiS